MEENNTTSPNYKVTERSEVTRRPVGRGQRKDKMKKIYTCMDCKQDFEGVSVSDLMRQAIRSLGGPRSDNSEWL